MQSFVGGGESVNIQSAIDLKPGHLPLQDRVRQFYS